MAETLLEAKNITVTFKSVLHTFDAVYNASLHVETAEAIGIVGESGSGKTTLARVLVGLQQPTCGEVLFEGKCVCSAKKKTHFPESDRWKVQMIFQDPYSSLNPRMRAWQAVAEALQVWRALSRYDAKAEAFGLLSSVGISHDQAQQFPRSLSGGQRQRVSVARALAPRPRILIADEPASSIDQSAQAQLLNLLRHLQLDSGLTIIFISHDLALVRYLTSRIHVMQKGNVVESGETRAVFEHPSHPCTQLLINSIPGRRMDTGVAETSAQRGWKDGDPSSV